MNKNSCNNCGKQGHQFHQCKLPITSYGIILFTFCPENGFKYLMIRRKNSFGYIDFMRGKYVPNDLEHLQIMFNEMSMEDVKMKDYYRWREKIIYTLVILSATGLIVYLFQK